ncbi:MAG: SurA N-terminal domain-containing protein [Alistipes sp.]|nr:SurA N-terminal domain-containing protein [Alistipes sp.]
MATLNTLRTKYGIVLSVVIGLVLVAFILGDQLGNRGAGQQVGSEPVCYEINGNKIKANEYLFAKYYDYAPMVYDHIIAPALAGMGLEVTDGEVTAAIKEQLGRMYASLKSSGYTDEQIDQYMNNNEVKMVHQMPLSLGFSKIVGLVSAGHNLNTLDIAALERQQNLSFDGRYVEVPYATIADADVVVSDEEIKAYYDAHLQKNSNYDSRTLKYVRFDRAASESDKVAAENSIKAIDAKLDAATNQKDFERAVLVEGGKVDGKYRAASTLVELAAIDKAGKYGPELVNDVWTLKYVVDEAMIPATYVVDRAQFEISDKAAIEAAVAALVANGGDFTAVEGAAEVENAVSVNVADVTISEATRYAEAKVGVPFTYNVGPYTYVAVVKSAGEKSRFVKVATVEVPITAGKDTTTSIDANIEKFMANMGNTVDTFSLAAAEVDNVAPTASATVQDGIRLYNALGSTEISTWAYNAKVGDTKRFDKEGVTYVVLVESIDDNEYLTLDELKNSIALKLRNDKKYDMIAQSLNTLEGDVKNFEGVKFSDSALDSHLVGAIVAAKEGVATKVKGNRAAYIFVVDKTNGEVAEDLAAVATSYRDQYASAFVQRAFNAYKQELKKNMKDCLEEGYVADSERVFNINNVF